MARVEGGRKSWLPYIERVTYQWAWCVDVVICMCICSCGTNEKRTPLSPGLPWKRIDDRQREEFFTEMQWTIKRDWISVVVTVRFLRIRWRQCSSSNDEWGAEGSRNWSLSVSLSLFFLSLSFSYKKKSFHQCVFLHARTSNGNFSPITMALPLRGEPIYVFVFFFSSSLNTKLM
jgi:hypothetical protein